MFLNRAGVLNGYSHRTRVGNWSEEQEMEELRMKNFIQSKEKGELLVHKIQKHMQTALKEVPLSYSSDGLIHIGDHVMLYSVETEGVLSADPSDPVALGSGERAFAVTTSGLVKAHVARNVFVIEAYGSEAKVGSPLKLGQMFRLRLNPQLLPDGAALYLQSQPVSALTASKISQKQLVCMSSVKSYDTVWKAQWKEISRRFEMEGQPCPANSEVVLLHAPTNTALSSSQQAVYFNDFGREYEVCGHSAIDIRKSQGLMAELMGKQTTDIPFRKENSPNHWAFLTAAAPELAAGLDEQGGASASVSQQSSLMSVLANVREDLLTRGPEHLFSLLASARAGDARRTGRLGYESFRKLLLQHGLKLHVDDFSQLCRIFDADSLGAVDYLAFLSAILGETGAARDQVADEAWNSLDESNDGSVGLSLLRSRYDASADPDVRLGRKDRQSALDAVLARFTTLCVNGRLGKEDWKMYYNIVSTFVQSDDYFCDLVASTWRLGQQHAGAAASSSSASSSRAQTQRY